MLLKTPRTTRTSNAERLILVSGIQPSGKLHIGNYLGALKNFVELQNTGRYQCYFSIVDLHSITEPFDPKEKHNQILELAADYLAAGLDPKKSVIFLQSQVPAHAELAWILNTITPMGELRRMTQFKEKTAGGGESANVGLFAYPVLMAADILLYNAEFVPVGNDQLQHLELARALARKFNSRFGATFLEPKAILAETPRVMSLLDPAKKMSKSEPDTCLFLDDTPEAIREKIKRAVTDSGSEITYDPERKPGVSNLLGIYSAFAGKPVKKTQEEFSGKNYGEFKSALAEAIIEKLTDFRKKKKALAKSPKNLAATLAAGSKKASAIAAKRIANIKAAVGLLV